MPVLETPTASTEAVRRRMQAVRRRDTPTELALRRILHARGYRYVVDVRPLPTLRRRADIVFRRQRVAVFVDGCFWHGCPEHRSWPKTNSDWWRRKLEANRRRDADTDACLWAAGWRAIHVWEHESLIAASDRVIAFVTDAKATASTPAAYSP